MTPDARPAPKTSQVTKTVPRAGPFQRLVIAIGGTDSEFVAQQWAIELAASVAVPVFAVHVAVEGTDPPKDVFSYVGRLAQKWGVGFQKHIAWGQDVAKVLTDELSPTDLLVMATRRMARQYHIGSVAAELVRRAPCPVQLVRVAD
jgi:nucleotide-binding universal stress UspA family protein